MKIATKAEFIGDAINGNYKVEEEKELNLIHITKGFQKALNKEFNNCIKICNIKFRISPANVSDSIDVAIDLENNTNLQDI